MRTPLERLAITRDREVAQALQEQAEDEERRWHDRARMYAQRSASLTRMLEED